MGVHPGIYQVLLLDADVAELVQVIPKGDGKSYLQTMDEMLL